MAFGIRLRIWGPFACFTRPEMKAERVSYDVLTPSAARGILEAIYWKPQIRWAIDRIHVLRPIRFTSMRRNEVGNRIPINGEAGVAAAMESGLGRLGLNIEDDRQQRAATLLRDVEYVVEAHFSVREPTDADGQVLNDAQAAAKHLDQFNRRARAGQCFHRPYLGCREFACDFEPLEGNRPIGLRPQASRGGSELLPQFYGTDAATRDLGYMLHDIDFAEHPEGEIIEGSAGRRVRATARFFRAQMRRGVIDVPLPSSLEVRS